MNKKLVGLILTVVMIFQALPAGAHAPMNLIEYTFGHMGNSIKELYSLCKEQISCVSVPRTAEDIVTVYDWRTADIDGENYYLINYFMNGKLQEEPLVAEYDCQVSGMKSDIKQLECGDMIIIDTYFDDTVDFIRVVMSLNNLDGEAEFSEQISVPEKAAWYLYGEEKKAKNEVYFGYIMKTEFDDGMCRLTMADRSGELVNTQVFNVTEGVQVGVYNAYKRSEENRFEKADIYDIEASVFPDDRGNIDFENEEFSKENMKYAFIYVNRGEIKEIMLVNYSK